MKTLVRFIYGLAVALVSVSLASAQELDPTFGPVETWQSASVYSTEVQPDGKLIVAGTFTRIGGRAGGGLVRLNADGTVDEAFTTAVAAKSVATKVRQFSNGQLVVTGYENLSLGGRTFNGVAKLNADGTLVAGFDPGTGPSSRVLTVATQPDNKTLLGGSFSSFNGTTVGGLVRLNADGSVDQDFAAALGNGFVGGKVAAVLVQADGKIVVGGQFSNVSGYSLHSLVRLNADGTVDTSFLPFPNARPSANSQVLALASDPRTGQVVAYVTNLGPGNLVRLLTTGQLDPTFTSSIFVNSVAVGFPNIDGPLAVDAVGGILLGGSFTSLNVQADRAYLARLLPTGEVDPQFVPQRFDDQIRTVRVLAGGEVLVGGAFSRYGELAQASLLKINGVTAQAQPAFQPVLDQPGTVASLAQQADGKLLLAGRFREVNGVSVNNLTRIMPNGGLDATFGLTGTDGPVDKVLALPDGRLLIGGRFTRVGTQRVAFVARLLADGQVDPSFQPPASSSIASNVRVYALALHTNGAVLISGLGLYYTGNVNLYRLLSDGSLDQNYTRNLAGQQRSASAIAVLSDGRHYVLGSFTRPGTTLTSGVVRLNADGTLDETFAFGTNSSSTVERLAVQPDNKVLVGGSFHSYNGIVRPNVARLNLDGSVDESFGVSKTGFDPDDQVQDLALQPDGQMLVAGSNRAYGYLHRLNSDGTLDPSFLGFSLYNGPVSNVLVQQDGRIITVGSFTEVGGQPRAGIARLTNSSVLAVGSRQPAATLEAWPNPVTDQLHLHLDGAARPGRVALLDLTGKTIYTTSATGAEMQLPVRQLAAGVYLLRVEYAAGPVTRRVVVE